MLDDRLVVGVVAGGVADVAGHQTAVGHGHVLGHPEGSHVELLQFVLPAYHLQLLAMTIVLPATETNFGGGC